MKCALNDFGIQPGLKQSAAAGFEVIVFSGFHRAFSVVMYNEGTLFGLLRRMFAYIDQRVYNVLKGIDIIVEKHNFILLYGLLLL